MKIRTDIKDNLNLLGSCSRTEEIRLRVVCQPSSSIRIYPSLFIYSFSLKVGVITSSVSQR